MKEFLNKFTGDVAWVIKGEFGILMKRLKRGMTKEMIISVIRDWIYMWAKKRITVWIIKKFLRPQMDIVDQCSDELGVDRVYWSARHSDWIFGDC